MKKLLSVFLAILMLLPLCISVSAEPDVTKSFTVYTGDSTKNYNPDRQVNVTITLRDINFGLNDGVSAFEFDILYDKAKVEPVRTADEDDDGDKGDFSKFISTNPASWEGFGLLDTEAAKYELAFSDYTGTGTFSEDDSIVIKIPFLVKSTYRVNDISFQIKNFRAYNSDMSEYCEAEVEDVIIRYAVQPAVNASLPLDAIPLHVAGYRHDVNNVIFYAKKQMTVGEYIKKFCSTAYDQDQMKNFAILIAGTDGVVTYVNTKNTDKSSVVIPEGHYLIGVHKMNTDDYAAFKEAAEVGIQVTVYNVNIESTGRTDGTTDLIRAAFAFYEVGEEPPFIGGIDPSENPKPDPEPEPVNGMKGDVNQNGKIDARDYLLLKRAYFGTYTLKCDQAIADINSNGKIDARDYLLLKRAYFGTYTIK